MKASCFDQLSDRLIESFHQSLDGRPLTPERSILHPHGERRARKLHVQVSAASQSEPLCMKHVLSSHRHHISTAKKAIILDRACDDSKLMKMEILHVIMTIFKNEVIVEWSTWMMTRKCIHNFCSSGNYGIATFIHSLFFHIIDKLIISFYKYFKTF